MIAGDVATRILMEVMRGIYKSDTDTPEEAEYRAETKRQVDEIHASGGVVDLPREWL